MDERRKDDTRIALLQQSHGSIIEVLHRMESKLDNYNQYRERVDNLCKSLDEHKSGHWKFATLIAAIVAAVVELINKAAR